MTVGPSPHLSWAELACRDAAKTPYPDAWRETRAVTLAAAFEAVRAECGDRPLEVLSAYRTPVHNRAVGGALNSQHLYGRALDLRPPKGKSVEWLRERALRVRAAIGCINGLGVYPRFLHLDTRAGPRLVVWHGSRPQADHVHVKYDMHRGGPR